MFLFPKDPIFECDFDENLCTCTQSQNDDRDWTWNQGGTDSVDTGPNGDHTSGNGKQAKMSDGLNEYYQFNQFVFVNHLEQALY